jgi:hypothetical protein
MSAGLSLDSPILPYRNFTSTSANFLNSALAQPDLAAFYLVTLYVELEFSRHASEALLLVLPQK